MFNPWLLAAAIFGLIGLADEFQKPAQKKPKALAETKTEKEKTSSVVVNVNGDGVKSPGKKPKSKPSDEGLPKPSGDG